MRRAGFGVATALLVVPLAVAGGVALGTGGAAAADAAEEQASLVEDFAYPGAAAILEEYGFPVHTGDGHIVFESAHAMDDGIRCAADQIQVEADSFKGTDDGAYYCFTTSGKRGFLTLELPHTFILRSGTQTVTATAELPGDEEKVVVVPAGQSRPVAPGASNQELPQAILVELRFGTW